MDSANAHAPPPKEMKEAFKKYQKLKFTDAWDEGNPDIIDFRKADELPEEAVEEDSLGSKHLLAIFQKFAGADCQELGAENAVVYSHRSLPGMSP